MEDVDVYAELSIFSNGAEIKESNKPQTQIMSQGVKGSELRARFLLIFENFKEGNKPTKQEIEETDNEETEHTSAVNLMILMSRLYGVEVNPQMVSECTLKLKNRSVKRCINGTQKTSAAIKIMGSITLSRKDLEMKKKEINIKKQETQSGLGEV